jgi:8-oxo-dGTP pyrophosphatase MutT (NUDIX family)
LRGSIGQAPRLLKPHRLLLRAAVTAFQAARRSVWFFTRPRVRGALAVPLTPEGRLVLVRLTYAKGWRLPGGGQRRRESAEEALLRELREEIGLTAYGEVRHLYDHEHEPDYRRATTSVFLVRDVRYRPVSSLEIERIEQFHPSGLPEDMGEATREHVAQALQAIAGRESGC